MRVTVSRRLARGERRLVEGRIPAGVEPAASAFGGRRPSSRAAGTEALLVERAGVEPAPRCVQDIAPFRRPPREKRRELGVALGIGALPLSYELSLGGSRTRISPLIVGTEHVRLVAFRRRGRNRTSRRPLIVRLHCPLCYAPMLLYPGRDSNLHWMRSERIASAVGLPGQIRKSRHPRHGPPRFPNGAAHRRR